TKTSSVSLVSFATRSSAWESKATNRPSAETAGRWLCPSPSHVLFGGGPAGAPAGGGGDEGGADDGGGVIAQGNRTLGETSSAGPVATRAARLARSRTRSRATTSQKLGDGASYRQEPVPVLRSHPLWTPLASVTYAR